MALAMPQRAATAATPAAAEDIEVDESAEVVAAVFQNYQCRCSSILSKGALPHGGCSCSSAAALLACVVSL